jgi:hypothetical protein
MARIVEANPKKLVEHGKHIFMFWNVNTQQVLYSFYPALEKRHLKQLAFIGKKSVPADIRPDFWKPYCTVTFPTAYQGLIAYRKLREFRRLHEVSWDKTQPELLKFPRKYRIRALMDQKANAVADLAQVLEIQRTQASLMKENIQNLAIRKQEFLAKKWAEIEELAKKAEQGEVARLEPEIKRLEDSLPRKTTDKEKERITKAIRLQTHRLKKLQWAQRQIAAREGAEKIAAPLEMVKVTEEKEGDQATATTETLALPAPKINLNNPVTTSVLPRHLQGTPPEPFSLEGVVVEWADLYDAEYAKDWPEAVTHDVMGTVRRRPPIPNGDRIAFPVFEPVAIAEAEAAEKARAEEEEKKKKEAEEKAMSWKDWVYLKNPLRVKSLHEDKKV